MERWHVSPLPDPLSDMLQKFNTNFPAIFPPVDLPAVADFKLCSELRNGFSGYYFGKHLTSF